MKPEILLSHLQLSLRQGNQTGAEFHCRNLLKQASVNTCPERLRTEIFLECARVFRAGSRHADAVQLCDLAIANIPAAAFDLLSSLKRLRALLYLDSEDYSPARNLINETDGLEMVLQGGTSVVKRDEADVMVETWLVATEIALAERDLTAAEDFFDKAVNRLSLEEAALRRKRLSPKENRKIQQYYHDLLQSLNLYGLIMSLLAGDERALDHLREMRNLIKHENDIALSQKNLPNVPLHSKLCAVLIGEVEEVTPEDLAGIPVAEAKRWASFGARRAEATAGAGGRGETRPAVNSLSIAEPQLSDSAELLDVFAEEFDSPAAGRSLILPGERAGRQPISQGLAPLLADEKALSAITGALVKFTAMLEQFTQTFPDFKNYLQDGNQALKELKTFLQQGQPDEIDYTQRGWSGHFRDIDLHNFLHNIKLQRWTGILKLSWHQDLYKSAVMKGLLPELISSGEASLYTVDGVVIDVVFKGQPHLNTIEEAQNNFLLITRMGFSVQVGDAPPDIIGQTIFEPLVAERPRLLRVNDDALVFVATQLEELANGSRTAITYFNADEDDSDFDDDNWGFGEQSVSHSQTAEISAAAPSSP